MQELLTARPLTVTAFRRWAREAAAAIEPKIDRDTLGEFDQQLHALVARIVRRAKAHAYRLGLYDLANSLPERQGKTCLDGLLRLRECADWREAQAAPDGPMSVRQTAEYLGISEWVVRRLISSGQLGHFRAGRQIRIRPAHLEAYQQRSETTGFRHLFR